MTYCLAITNDNGLIFLSDSRTTEGVDVMGTNSKMHGFGVPGERQLTLLTSGNLAVSQSVVGRLKTDIRKDEGSHLFNLDHMNDVVDYVGEINREESEKAGGSADIPLLIGGQIQDHRPRIYMVYPQGNYISTSIDTPFLQIGESKYGKPILDRIIKPEISLETAAMCGLVSMDSTIRSNLTVGPPVELVIYERDSLAQGRYYRFDEDSKYLRQLKRSWDGLLKEAFEGLPPVEWSASWDMPQAGE